jgi:hypothetical protein
MVVACVEVGWLSQCNGCAAEVWPGHEANCSLPSLTLLFVSVLSRCVRTAGPHWAPICMTARIIALQFSDNDSDTMFTRKCENLLIASSVQPPPHNTKFHKSVELFKRWSRLTGIHFMQRLHKMHIQEIPSEVYGIGICIDVTFTSGQNAGSGGLLVMWGEMLSALECCQYACHMFTACETKALWPWGGLCRQGERHDPALVFVLLSSGLWHHVVSCCTGVSGCQHLRRTMLTSTPKVETVCFSRTLLPTYQTTRSCHNRKDSIMNLHCKDNVKSLGHYTEAVQRSPMDCGGDGGKDSSLPIYCHISVQLRLSQTLCC